MLHTGYFIAVGVFSGALGGGGILARGDFSLVC